MHLVEPIIFSLYHVIIRPTKIIKAADKNWAHLKQKHLKNQKFRKISVISSPIFFTEKNQKDSSNFQPRKMTLKIRILRSLRKSSKILVGLMVT